MAFTSVCFLVFLLATLALYYLLPKKAQWVLLLAASYAFYWMGGGATVLYLVFTTLTVYVAGRILGALNARPKADAAAAVRTRRQKKWVVLATVLVDFGLLFVVKYGSFTVELLQPLAGGKLPAVDFVLPLGISFYMFQSVGYVIDCYRGKYPVERNPFKLALFTSFFPQIVQGPISRFRDLGPQLTAPHRLDWDKIKYGIQLAMWGYFKKLVIAERAAVLVDTVLAHYYNYSGSVIMAAIFFYCIQLYCDFSGGIDITRGVAGMFGIELAENFRRPLYATSLADYWRRWHMTLGQWMRDYLFYPLTLSKPLGRLGKWTRRHIPGKLGKLIPAALATFVVYFVIGIWHGANFRYIVFGLWNGTLITASFLLEGWFAGVRARLHIRDESRLWHLFQIARTCVLVFWGRYLTRAPRLLAAGWMMWQSVANPCFSNLWDGTLLTLGLTMTDIVITLCGMAAVLGLEYYQERGGHVRAALEQRHWLVQWLGILLPLIAILLFGILLRGDYTPSAFIYQQF